MRPDDFDVNRVIDALKGTPSSIKEVLERLYPEMIEAELTEADKEEIDHNIFLCTECDWWFDSGDRSSLSEKKWS